MSLVNSNMEYICLGNSDIDEVDLTKYLKKDVSPRHIIQDSIQEVPIHYGDSNTQISIKEGNFDKN
jgi:hypothetical protein